MAFPGQALAVVELSEMHQKHRIDVVVARAVLVVVVAGDVAEDIAAAVIAVVVVLEVYMPVRGLYVVFAVVAAAAVDIFEIEVFVSLLVLTLVRALAPVFVVGFVLLLVSELGPVVEPFVAAEFAAAYAFFSSDPYA